MNVFKLIFFFISNDDIVVSLLTVNISFGYFLSYLNLCGVSFASILSSIVFFMFLLLENSEMLYFALKRSWFKRL